MYRQKVHEKFPRNTKKYKMYDLVEERRTRFLALKYLTAPILIPSVLDCRNRRKFLCSAHIYNMEGKLSSQSVRFLRLLAN